MACTNLPTALDICRVRGDTFPFEFNVKDENGVAINITGFSFLLTVDPSSEPTDALGNLFQLTGAIVSGPGGVVRFTLSTGQADQTPSEYFYDLQMTDLTAAIRTIAKGGWNVVQDITK